MATLTPPQSKRGGCGSPIPANWILQHFPDQQRTTAGQPAWCASVLAVLVRLQGLYVPATRGVPFLLDLIRLETPARYLSVRPAGRQVSVGQTKKTQSNTFGWGTEELPSQKDLLLIHSWSSSAKSDLQVNLFECMLGFRQNRCRRWARAAQPIPYTFCNSDLWSIRSPNRSIKVCQPSRSISTASQAGSYPFIFAAPPCSARWGVLGG